MALHTIVEHDTTHIKPYIDNVKQALSDEVVTRTELGAHNLLSFPITTATSEGVEFTVQEDGTITAVGQVDAHKAALFDFFISDGSEPYIGKDVFISGSPSGGSAVTYMLTAYRVESVDGSSGSVFDYGYGVSANFKNNASGTPAKLRIQIYGGENGFSVNQIWKPMIRLASDTDPTYQPYAMTNKELTDVKADKSDLASISITGTTNNTGDTIPAGTYFYLNGTLVKAKVSIASNATLTLNTNYEVVTAGGLNSVPHFLSGTVTDMQALPIDGTLYNYTIPEDGYYGAYAINADVAGVVGLAILDLNSHYICSIPNTVTASYQRAACPPVPLRKGTTLVFRAWATDNAYIYKLT